MKDNEQKELFFNSIKNNIKQYNLSVIKIEATENSPSFAYSIGLKETFNHPEIICFGLPTELLQQLINDVVAVIKKDGFIKLDVEYTNIFEGSRAKFLKVDSNYYEDYLGAATAYYKTKDIEVLQLIWPDRNNKFPWENGFEKEFQFKQPLLDSYTGFKFIAK